MSRKISSLYTPSLAPGQIWIGNSSGPVSLPPAAGNIISGDNIEVFSSSDFIEVSSPSVIQWNTVSSPTEMGGNIGYVTTANISSSTFTTVPFTDVGTTNIIMGANGNNGFTITTGGNGNFQVKGSNYSNISTTDSNAAITIVCVDDTTPAYSILNTNGSNFSFS